MAQVGNTSARHCTHFGWGILGSEFSQAGCSALSLSLPRAFDLGFWDQPSLLSELRHSILKSLVARKCFQAETAKRLESWPPDRSGFSAFVGVNGETKLG